MLWYGSFVAAEELSLIIRPLDTHPVCEHGPALLFQRRVDNKRQQFYACSAYRDQKECQLHILVDETKQTTSYNRDLLMQNAHKSVQLAQDISKQMQKVTVNVDVWFSFFAF